MNKIQSFKNAQEFQELFGVQEHGNGVKSRRNKILLALLKSKTVWAYCKENDNWDLLAIKSMAELKSLVTKKIVEAGIFQALDYEVMLNGTTYHSSIYETDEWKGIPEDGSLGFVRYINHDNGSDVYKMKAGKFYSKLILETKIGQALPQQVQTWLCEEFSMDWQVYIAGTLPNFTLVVDEDFEAIYSGDDCAPGMNSCMIDRGYHNFYRDSVKAKAAKLVDEDGVILARAVIFTEAYDENDKVWRLCERQYAKDCSDILKRALVDALIKGKFIDAYKFVGADCGNSRGFVDLEGNSLSHKKFYINCELDYDEPLSYQDSFKYFNIDSQVAYNYHEPTYTHNLDTTNGRLYDEDSSCYDEYHDRDVDATVAVFYHGSEITCDEEELDDFEYFIDNYYHEDDLTECPECGGTMYHPDYYSDDLYYSSLTQEYYCCQKCRSIAEQKYREENWCYCDFDQLYYESESELTNYLAWNEDLGEYETKKVCKEKITAYLNGEVLFKIGDQLYDRTNNETGLPLEVETEVEALIEV